MNLLRRAFTEHPVAAFAVAASELVLLLVIVSVISGRPFLSVVAGAILSAAIGLPVILLASRHRRSRRPR
jgi:hypothetical protein